MRRWVAPFALVALSCGPTRTAKVHPQLIPPPATVDFGQLPVLNEKKIDLPLQNVGRASLLVESAVIKESGVPFRVAAMPQLVETGATENVTVAFIPPLQQSYAATCEITTDDPQNPIVDVALKGEGSTVAVMAVNPPILDFGRVGEGTSAIRTITVLSEGTADLIVNGISFVDGGSSQFSFIGSTTTPATVKKPAYDGGPPGQLQITVRYTVPAGADAGAQSAVEISGTDPNNTLIEVPLDGGINRAPIPKIAPVGNAAPGMTVNLDGTGSYDPDGDNPLTYKWTLASKPLGANTTLSSNNQPTTSLTLDPNIPGEYDVNLDVTDAAGAKDLAPAKVAIIATPAQQLLIELYQDNPDTDLDLHFLKTPYTQVTSFPNDCYPANPNPDWTGSGDPTQSPQYIQDALTGYGPDIVGYDNPIAGSTFRIVVEFFNSHLAANPTTTATVRIYEFGVEKGEFSRAMQQQGDYWGVADIAWPAGTITALP